MGLRIGIDAGSKTVKLAFVDEAGELVFSSYRRHRSDIRTTLKGVFEDAIWRMGDCDGAFAVTGSAGIGLAEALDLPFVQEVVATTRAVRRVHPDADAVIELGGEDAKVMYLTGVPEQRMNATCAGGTGGFIDTIAYMMGVRAGDMSDLGMSAKHIYPIASRCAVFAQTDIRPLLNAGARKADIAGSALEAVVRQTLGGLACGRPLRGTVVFLGGPLEHIPDLVRRFRSALGLTRETGIKPENAHLYAAVGAALSVGDEHAPQMFSLSGLLAALDAAEFPDDSPRLPAFFADESERSAFLERTRRAVAPRTRLFDCVGSLYVGIDAGSTAVKIAVIDEQGRLAYGDYQVTGGDVLKATASILKRFYQALPRAYGGKPLCTIAHAAVTGYGENLLKEALSVDSGVVETVAHATAALHVCPDASFLLDIGGQDMKALWLEDGRIADATLNEACSSGCGAFVSGTAHALKLSLDDFAEAAMRSESPLDLGTKCTVFMNSKVKHAQKSGVSLDDIAAGVAYSVARNALVRVLGGRQALPRHGTIVVQGGAFMSDAVLRAFELVAGAKVTRPDKAHMMGALGAALVARARAVLAQAQVEPQSQLRLTPDVSSNLIDREALAKLKPTQEAERCAGCENACVVSLVSFGDGRRFVSGNRCERAHVALGLERHDGKAAQPPNVVALKQKLLARYGNEREGGHRGNVRIGLTASLLTYDQTPFWHTLLSHLGFSVRIPSSRLDTADSLLLGMDTIPSESVCYPAKLAHARVRELIDAGCTALLMPVYERGRRCPVASGYARVFEANVPEIFDGEIALLHPELHKRHPHEFGEGDRQAVLDALNSLLAHDAPIGEEELSIAMEAAIAEQGRLVDLVARGNQRAYEWSISPGGKGVVLAGRPYHADPSVLHEVDLLLQELGCAVISGEDLTLEEPWLRQETPFSASAVNPGLSHEGWDPAEGAKRLARAVGVVGGLQLVHLRSFGCGLDAGSLPEIKRIVRESGKPFTAIKMDDMIDTAHVRIRLRTHFETAERASGSIEPNWPCGAERLPSPSGSETLPRSLVEDAREGSVRAFSDLSRLDIDAAREHTQDLCFVVAALAGRAIRLARADAHLSALTVPETCQKCLLQFLPGIVGRACGRSIRIEWMRAWPSPSPRPIKLPSGEGIASAPGQMPRKPVGIVGPPPLCFDPFMNDRIKEVIESQGFELVPPRMENLLIDDARYLDQVNEYAARGVNRIVYLQSFGCLKGHICSRGALRSLERSYPHIRFTVLDYDVESSALNRENRLRLTLWPDT